MFFIKILSKRNQFKVGSPPDWTPLGFHSSFTTSVLLPLITEFILPHPPHPEKKLRFSH